MNAPNTRRAALLLLLLVGCGDPATKAADEPSPEDSGGAPDDTGDTGEPSCDPAPLPVAQAYLPGFTGSEDFAFDAEGYLVSVDELGNLVGINKAGEARLMLPDASLFAAGTRFHPSGDLLLNAADRGELMRINPNTGGSAVVVGGLEYPNGLEVDAEGFAYVAEQISGRVRRIDPDTGAFTFIASGLYNPNGLAFSPDESTLYIGSFGGGVVWTIQREGEGWTEPAVYAASPGSPGVPPNLCAEAVPGTSCALPGGYGIGACTIDDLGDARCLADLDTEACAGLSIGADCTTELFGEPIAQRCVPTDGGALFCPRVPDPLTKACARAEDGVCVVSGEEGFCLPNFEGVEACYLPSLAEDAYTQGCVGLVEGDDCQIRDPLFPSLGSCRPGDDFGFTGLACLPADFAGELGGLDGVAADLCGNVYVTEYVIGEVWRFSGPGADGERVAALDSEWIPNLRWGNGVGGWAIDHLYVMDRLNQGVFDLSVGVQGR